MIYGLLATKPKGSSYFEAQPLRKMGPLLLRISCGVTRGEGGDALMCFLSCYGVTGEAALVVRETRVNAVLNVSIFVCPCAETYSQVHCVEPRSVSVSVLPLGEAELRGLCRVAPAAAGVRLLARWLGAANAASPVCQIARRKTRL